MREILVLTGKLHNAAFVVRPGRYFVRRLLQLNKLHFKGDERSGGWGARERYLKREEAKRVSRLTVQFMADLGWKGYVQQEHIMEGERMAAPVNRFVKQAPERWFSDASYELSGGCAWTQECTGGIS